MMTNPMSSLGFLFQRRSIRRFTQEPVSRTEIDALLHGAMAAPSASNRRPWEFVVATEPDILDRLRRVLILGRHVAPAAIIVCGNMRRTYPPPARDFWVEDCSAAMQNILLGAQALGLGGVWIVIHPVPPFLAGVRRVLGLPRHVRPLGLAWIGHPSETKPPRSQYDERRVHWQTFGGTEPESVDAPAAKDPGR